MQYLTALLLPATVLASPLVAVRQETKAVFLGWSLGSEPGCGNDVSVEFSDSKQIANVSLPSYNVTLPDRNGSREKACSVVLTVRFPVNACTTGYVAGTASGHVQLPIGGEAKFHARDYAISPTPPGNHTQISPNGEWRTTAATGPINEDYTLDDRIYYYFTPKSDTQDVNFTVQGRLQLQPSNGASGSLSNDRLLFDLGTQIPCCKSKPMLTCESNSLVGIGANSVAI